MSKTFPAALSAIALALAAGAAQAAAFDPAAWTLGGDGNTSAGSIVLTNASTGVDDNVDGIDLDAGARNVSGRDPLDAGADLPGFLHLADFDAINAATHGSWAAEGSAAQQVFTADAGSTLSFRWDLSTLERSSDPALADLAFMVVDGKLIALGDTLAATTASDDAHWFTHTGWTDATFTFTSGGSHIVSFVVADIGSYGDSSELAVGNVSLAPAAAVPEAPGTTMLAAGLGLLALMRRRQGRR